MSTVAEINDAIRKLSETERAELESLIWPDWDRPEGDSPPGIGEKLGEVPGVVVLHLVNQVLERIVVHAEAKDLLEMGDAGAFAVGTGGAVLLEWLGAFFA